MCPALPGLSEVSLKGTLLLHLWNEAMEGLGGCCGVTPPPALTPQPVSVGSQGGKHLRIHICADLTLCVPLIKAP